MRRDHKQKSTARAVPVRATFEPEELHITITARGRWHGDTSPASAEVSLSPTRASTPKLALTPEEAGELLGVSRTHIYRLIRNGELASLKLGKARRIRVDDLRHYLEKVARDG